ncbi:Epimerase domain-containing protein [Mycena venus]|uniref:Epimerase domain-containing protein n=1 Tax=Mycena venus TaxID=2733690 RepID=A0A8H6WXR8_9AGAR|nr:Epimerase domain-containing protein [Mycena venus]
MSTESKPLVFVTGASGYLGFEVVYQLLQAGYPVRGAARGRKIPLLKKAFGKYPQFEAVEVTDVASADFSVAFNGVGAIIHTAAPLPGRADSETAFKSAIEGSLHILREAHKAGVKKFIATGSMVTFPDNAYGPDDWVAVTKEQAVEGNPFVLYIAEKKFGEQAVLEFAEKHPEMDITIFCPPWIFGPFAPGFEHIIPEPDFSAFSTNGFVYQLLRADNVNYNYSPGMLDVRDVARVHIAGLNPLTPDHPRRVPVVSQYPNDWRDAIKLRGRLADPSKAPVWESYRIDAELKPVEEAFGVKLSSYKTWKETILDAVDRFIEVENQWKAKGLKFEVPTTPPM